jgi:hypothetical protein
VCEYGWFQGRQAGGTAWREVVLSFSRRRRVPVCDACDRDLDQHEGRCHDRLQTERCQKKMIILGTTQSRRPGTHPHQPLACTVLYCSTKGLDASGRGVIQQVALEAGTKTTSAQLHKRFE